MPSVTTHTNPNPNSDFENIEELGNALKKDFTSYVNYAASLLDETELLYAKDIVQNVFLNIVKQYQADSFHLRSSLKSYVYSSVRNGVISLPKKYRRSFEVITDTPSIEVELFFETSSKFNKTLQLLRQRNESYFKVLNFVLRGYSYKDIAAKIPQILNHKVAKAKYHRAKKLFIEIWLELPDDPDDDGPRGYNYSQHHLDQFLSTLIDEGPIDGTSFKSYVIIEPPYNRHLFPLGNNNLRHLITKRFSNTNDREGYLNYLIMEDVTRVEALDTVDGYFKLLNHFGGEDKLEAFYEESKKLCFEKMINWEEKVPLVTKSNLSFNLSPLRTKHFIQEIFNEPEIKVFSLFNIQTNKELNHHSLIPVDNKKKWGAIIPTSSYLSYLEIKFKDNWVVDDLEQTLRNLFLQEIETAIKERISKNGYKDKLILVIDYGGLIQAFKEELYHSVINAQLNIWFKDKDNKGDFKEMYQPLLYHYSILTKNNKIIFNNLHHKELKNFKEVVLCLNKKKLEKELNKLLKQWIPEDAAIPLAKSSFNYSCKEILKNDSKNKLLQLAIELIKV